MYDSRYRATYDFVAPIEFDFIEFIGCAAEYLGRFAGHFIFDMVPYYIGGNNKGEFSKNPLIWLDITGIPNKVAEAYYGFWNPIKYGAMQYLDYLSNPKKMK